MQHFVDPDAAASAQRAAGDFAVALADVLASKPMANVVFAGAESQQPFHHALTRRDDVEWSRLRAFAVDEFYAPDIPIELTVAAQPKRDLYAHVSPAELYVIDHAAANAAAERSRYEALIRTHQPDIACLGIGRSGHVAFNEPGQTDFDDPRIVRVIDVCEQSKRQLMTDPNFKALGRIPAHGITITLPTLMRAKHVLVNVPYESKAQIIKRLFDATEVTPDLPATVLKRAANVRLYLDATSFLLCGD